MYFNCVIHSWVRRQKHKALQIYAAGHGRSVCIEFNSVHPECSLNPTSELTAEEEEEEGEEEEEEED